MNDLAASHHSQKLQGHEQTDVSAWGILLFIGGLAAAIVVMSAGVWLVFQFLTTRQAEIDRVRGRLGHMTPEQEIAVEALTRGIINKVMHTPITTLKTAAKESEATTVVDVVRRLFNLQVKGKSDAAPKKDEVGTRQ